jgi:hypothetical protein
MPDFFYAGAAASRKLPCDLPVASPLPAGTPSLQPGAAVPAAHPELTPEIRDALLAAVDRAGIAGIGELAAAIPHHPRPISAVLALVDTGLLALDLQSGFDASLRVWRPAA